MSARTRALAVCTALVLALLVTAVLAPLPYSLAYPGMTANVLGADDGKPVITITGAQTRKTSGQLRMTSIVATGPEADVRLPDIVKGWFRTDEAVMPREAVYPVGENTEEIAEHNAQQMRESQDTATSAALGQLGRSGKGVKVKLSLADVGGPSAGLMFALGIVDKLDGDGAGHDLTGGRKISRHRDHHGRRHGRRGGRRPAEDAGREAGRRHGLPGPAQGVRGRAGGAAEGDAADPGQHARRRGGRAAGAADRGQDPELLRRPAGRARPHPRAGRPPLTPP